MTRENEPGAQSADVIPLAIGDAVAFDSASSKAELHGTLHADDGGTAVLVKLNKTGRIVPIERARLRRDGAPNE